MPKSLGGARARFLAAAMASALAWPAAAWAAPTCQPGETSHAYSFTGSTQTLNVPANVHAITVYLSGAQGGNGIGGNGNTAGTGGLGAQVSGRMSVAPGDTLTIGVGGQGSLAVNPGGSGGGDQNAGSARAGNGGGATGDCRRVAGGHHVTLSARARAGHLRLRRRGQTAAPRRRDSGRNAAQPQSAHQTDAGAGRGLVGGTNPRVIRSLTPAKPDADRQTHKEHDRKRAVRFRSCSFVLCAELRFSSANCPVWERRFRSSRRQASPYVRGRNAAKSRRKSVRRFQRRVCPLQSNRW